jgi:hypothetical protein
MLGDNGAVGAPAPVRVPFPKKDARITRGVLNPSKRGRPPKPHRADFGHNAGTAGPQVLESAKANGRPEAQQAIAPLVPRLLYLRGAAHYLSISARTVWALMAAGTLPRVRLVLPNGAEVRKVLFDVQDLNKLVDGWKDGK